MVLIPKFDFETALKTIDKQKPTLIPWRTYNLYRIIKSS